MSYHCDSQPLFSVFPAVIRQEQIQPVQSARTEQVRKPILVVLIDLGKFAVSCNAGTVS